MLFEPDIPRDFQHIKITQYRCLEHLVELIPARTPAILDVGAGSGKTAEMPFEKCFEV